VRRIVLVVGALILATGGADAATVSSGLHGKVLRQVGGACEAGSDCMEPIPGMTLAFSRDGQATVRMTTRADGTYRVRLVPGMYRVKVLGAGPRAKIQPALASVRRGSFRTIDFVVAAATIP
jgi:hypothetical protein